MKPGDQVHEYEWTLIISISIWLRAGSQVKQSSGSWMLFMNKHEYKILQLSVGEKLNFHWFNHTLVMFSAFSVFGSSLCLCCTFCKLSVRSSGHCCSKSTVLALTFVLASRLYLRAVRESLCIPSIQKTCPSPSGNTGIHSLYVYTSIRAEFKILLLT